MPRSRPATPLTAAALFRMAWNPSYRAPRSADVQADAPLPEPPWLSETEQRLLDAVLTDPDADAPRSAYTEWCDHQGDSARAGWIRDQIETSRRLTQKDADKNTELNSGCDLRFSAFICRASSLFAPYGGSDFVVRRGFVEGMSLTGRAFISLGKRLMRMTPLRDVRLVAVQPFLGELARCTHLANLRRLDLTGNRIGSAGVQSLASSPFLGNLRELGMNGNHIRPAGFHARLDAPWAGNLTTLELADNGLGTAELARLPALAALDFSGNVLEAIGELPSGLERLKLARCRLKQFPDVGCGSLREIDLSHNRLGPDGAYTLAENESFSNLRSLDLSFNDIETAGVVALCGMEAPLELLNLRGNRITEAGAQANADGFGSVVHLDLGTNPIGDAGAAALVRGEALSSLERLSLANCGITDDGVKALASSGALGGLRELSLAWNAFGDSGVKSLAACPDLAGLRHLDLTGTRIGFAGAIALAESPHLTRLRSVTLGENERLPADGVAVIRERYNAPHA